MDRKKEVNIYLFLLIFIVKFAIYYFLIEISDNIILHTMISMGLLFIIFLYMFKTSLKRRIFFSIYLIITFLMLINVVYTKYFNESFRLSYFRYFSEFIDVIYILPSIIEAKHFLVLLDVVVLAFFLIRIKHKKDNFEFNKYIPIAAFVLILTFTIVNPLNNEDIESLGSSEFFNYYIKDAYSLLSGEEVNIDNVEEFSFLKEAEGSENKELYGIAEGRNLIVIQVESLQNMVVNKEYNGQEITPNLNRLISEDSIYFNNFYQQLGKGNTSYAEFVSNNSIYAPIHGQAFEIYQDSYFYGLPWILKEKGYSTAALHGYRGDFWNRDMAYPAQGFDVFYSEKDYDFEERLIMGIGDSEFFEQSIGYIKELEKPLYSMLITLTSHGPYNLPENERMLDLEERDKGTLFGDYLQAVNYTDRAIGDFIEYLKREGLYDNSIIAVYGDHFGITTNDSRINDRVSEFVGKNYDYDEMLKVPFIINIPGEDVNRVVDTAGGQVDFMPTVLNLMGVETSNPIIFGQDLVNAEDGFVVSQTYMVKGSYIDDEIVFEMSRDGVFKNSRAWNKNTGEEVDIEECREGYEKAQKLLNESVYILENDILRQVVE